MTGGQKCPNIYARIFMKPFIGLLSTERFSFDRQDRAFRQQPDPMRDATAKSRFDAAESARPDNDYICIVVLGAGDNGACDGVFFHFADDIVDAVLPRPFLRIRHQIAGDFLQDIHVQPWDMFQVRIVTQAFRNLLGLQHIRRITLALRAAAMVQA